MIASPTEVEIQSELSPHCIVCGSEGELIYTGLRDTLFGASGTWNIKRCSNANCGLLWPDPKPLANEIWKAYANYYTHRTSGRDPNPGGFKKLYYIIKGNYLAIKYGYPIARFSFWHRSIGFLLYAFPIRRSDVDAEVRYLQARAGGNLLDVGCGSGEWLEMMNSLGWKAQGIDFDVNAVEVARKNGLTVDVGTLESQRYPSDYFDVVTLNHVIEHVPDPLGLLQECLRILKPGGVIALATPNSEGLGNLFFKQYWRGLEPPRHLQILSTMAMRQSLISAGFRDVTVRTYNSPYVLEQSYRMSRKQNMRNPTSSHSWSTWIAVTTLAWVEQLLLVFRPRKGECIAASAKK